MPLAHQRCSQPFGADRLSSFVRSIDVDLTPEELLLAAIVRLAIRDAIQGKKEKLRDEALRWLWWFAPTIAERAGVPHFGQ